MLRKTKKILLETYDALEKLIWCGDKRIQCCDKLILRCESEENLIIMFWFIDYKWT